MSVYLKVPDNYHDILGMCNDTGIGIYIREHAEVLRMRPIQADDLVDDPCVTYTRDPLADPEVSTRAAIVKYILDTGLVLRAGSNEDLLMLASWVELGTEKMRDITTEGNTSNV